MDYIIQDFAVMCLLIHPLMPPMQFLFVGTGICSPAYFRYSITAITLAAC